MQLTKWMEEATTIDRPRGGGGGQWGGFLLAEREPGVLHATLTGRLTVPVLEQLHHELAAHGRDGGRTSFLVLDAGRLTHIAPGAARMLAVHEAAWRSTGRVAAWVQLSPYLRNLLLLLSAEDEPLPAFDSTDEALSRMRDLAGAPASLAHDRLAVAGDLRR